MSERLCLPEIFTGKWENLLIVSFGVDLPFFENAILRSNFTCRNKVILGDGRKLLQAYERYARDRKVRMLNQTYVADGIYVHNAAHAKIILLLKHDEGRLYVGSGNLGIQGYTSGGEMFTSYDYTAKEQGALAAFQSVWEFVDILLKRGAIGGASESYLRRMYQDTPWLMRNPGKEWRPVRHNLNSSLIEQLTTEVEGEKVQELWVMSPFFDEKAIALSNLIKTFNPDRVNLIIQPQYVSLKKSALENAINKYKGKIFICPFETFSDINSVYVHTKLYLLKTKKRAICLQGSPNCSQAALMLPSPLGNIEIANLLTGARDSFDELFKPLDLLPPLISTRSLNLKYDHPDKSTEIDVECSWLLTGARWHNESLYLYFHKDIPDFKGAQLQIGNLDFMPTVIGKDGRTIEVKLPQNAQNVLSAELSPIVLKVGSKASSPIFPYNMDMLAREAQNIQYDIITRSFEDFDPADDEFENLLLELSASFPIDRRSIWQLAGVTPPTVNDEDDDKALQIKYIDIDYDLLCQHPKIQQYIHQGSLIGEYQHTRLQEILNSITRHFQGLTNVALGKDIRKPLPVIEEGENEVAADDSAEENKTLDKKPVKRKRMQRILKSFIRRYLRGIKSRDFIELVGADVIANNYIIFSHILWKLLQKDWMEFGFVVEAILQMWSFFWGNSESNGHLSGCDKQTRSRAIDLIYRQKNNALVIACLFYSDYKCAIEGKVDLRLQLRETWRCFLAKKPFDITSDTLLAAWVYLHEALPYFSPTPGYIVSALESLSRLDTSKDFLLNLDHRLGTPQNTCRFVQQDIYRESIDASVQIDCLEINSDKAINNLDDALSILFVWMQYGKREFYRLSNPRFILLYDTAVNKGVFHNRATKENIDLLELSLPDTEKWQNEMKKVIDLAQESDRLISIELSEFNQKVASDL